MARRRRGIGFPQRAHALVALLAGGSQASFFDGVFMAYRCTASLLGLSGAPLRLPQAASNTKAKRVCNPSVSLDASSI